MGLGSPNSQDSPEFTSTRLGRILKVIAATLLILGLAGTAIGYGFQLWLR